MMLKYISGLKALFEVQPQFFVSTDPKQMASSVGALGKRLFIVEKIGTIPAEGEKQMKYVNALNVAALEGPITVDDTTFQFTYPEGAPVLTPEEVAAVGAPQRDLEKFTAGFNELIPNSQVFHIPGTIKGLKVPGGKEAWALININKGKLHMRVAPSIASLDEAQEVPIAECGTIDGDHMFPVPLDLIKKPLDLEDKVAYSFVQDADGNYYFITRAPNALCVYSCMAYKVADIPEGTGAPEIVEEVEDVEAQQQTSEEPAEEPQAEEADEPTAEPVEQPEAEDSELEKLTQFCDDDGSDDEDGPDDGTDDGVCDGVVEGSEADGSEADGSESPEKAEPVDYPLMETLDDDLKEMGRRIKRVIGEEMVEFERKRKNIAKQVRPMAKLTERLDAISNDDTKKKLQAAEGDLAAAKKKLAAIKQELAPYRDLLKINWKLLD